LIPPKIADVEGKDLIDPVNDHCCYKVGVMGVLSANLMLHN